MIIPIPAYGRLEIRQVVTADAGRSTTPVATTANAGTGTQSTPQSSQENRQCGPGTDGGTIAGIVIGCILGTILILWLINAVRNKQRGAPEASANPVGGGTRRRKRSEGTYDGYETNAEMQGRRGSGVYNGCETKYEEPIHRHRRRSDAGRSRIRARSRGSGYVAFEKVAAPPRAVYRD